MKALVIEIAHVLFTSPLGLFGMDIQPEAKAEKQPHMNFWDILDSRC